MIITGVNNCKTMILPFSITIVAGIYFILLFLYWMLAFWWSKISVGSSKNISFSLLTILWFFHSMLLVATLSSLAIAIYERTELIIKLDIDTNSTECSEMSYKDILRLPLIAEGSMGLLCVIYFCVFLANVCCACRKNNEDRETST